jgi:hypothetical protein
MDKTCKNCAHWDRTWRLKIYKDKDGEFSSSFCKMGRQGILTRTGNHTHCGLETAQDYYCPQFQPLLPPQ